MAKKYKIMDNITALYVLVMTFAVSFTLSSAQSNDTNLYGNSLLIFLIGFWGSVICILIRYVFLYYKVISQKRTIKKMLMMVYLIAGSSIFVLSLAAVLKWSHFSIIHDVLSNYNAYQIFMVAILLSQWLGEKLQG
ncbi:MAG: hypothetical protein NC094_00300 [Bacteroidales bacterium]|nr:hypothetical protein [Lachnoclostridium sp.]MCM1384628.1 hypothetical protein [Lachnoclostridium sp.]MCM1463833.1 hypothetical protein [Bacteroidales bacterium]